MTDDLTFIYFFQFKYKGQWIEEKKNVVDFEQAHFYMLGSLSSGDGEVGSVTETITSSETFYEPLMG